MHLIESDPALSKPITDDPSAPNPGAGDWFVLIDGTDVDAVLGGSGSALRPSCGIRGGNSDIGRRLRPDVGSCEERPSDIEAALKNTQHAALPHFRSAALTLGGQTNWEWRLSKNGF